MDALTRKQIIAAAFEQAQADHAAEYEGPGWAKRLEAKLDRAVKQPSLLSLAREFIQAKSVQMSNGFSWDESYGPNIFHAPETPTPPPPIDWTAIVLGQAVHVMVVGPTSSGKTTIAQVLAAKAPGQLAIIDPLWEPSTWGGLPGAAVTGSGDFEPIRKAIEALNRELHRRMGLLQKGNQRFPQLNIIWDEVPLCVSEVKEAGELIRSLGNFGRHANMHMIGMSQSDRVGSWGLEGYGDASENFTHILLGSKAIERDPTLAGVDHPAVVDWQGQLFPIDMTAVRELGEVEAQPTLAQRTRDVFSFDGQPTVMMSVADVDAAALKVHPSPSEAQKKAGNYQKGHVTIQGLPITIETARDQERSGTGADGKAWSVTLPHHYGYVKRTESEADGDHIDVFIGPDPESEIVFVIDQQKPSGRFDEHKCMLGFTNARAAKEGYLGAYSAGWTGLGDMRALTMEQFKAWIEKGETGKRIAEQPINFSNWNESDHPRGQPGNPGEFASAKVYDYDSAFHRESNIQVPGFTDWPEQKKQQLFDEWDKTGLTAGEWYNADYGAHRQGGPHAGKGKEVAKRVQAGAGPAKPKVPDLTDQQIAKALQRPQVQLSAGWEEGKHPRGQPTNAGEFASQSGAHQVKPELQHRSKPQEQPKPKVASEPIPDFAREFHVLHEQRTPSSTGLTYNPPVDKDRNGDGVSDFARVGVPGNWVPPPPKTIPRLPNLTPDERAVEDGFAKRFEENPDELLRLYEEGRNAGTIGDAPNIFGTDDCKALDPHWAPPAGSMSDEEIRNNRATFNTPLHQTANAIAKRAFLKHLDTLGEGKKSVLVTAGGVGAGKGYAIKKVGEVSQVAGSVGAVWDSAGDQNATENPWIQHECEKRGIKVYYAYVHANPYDSWAAPGKGVIERAGKNGRMVDAKVFADSYVHGAKNFAAFAKTHKDNPNAHFFYIDNTGQPRKIEDLPPAAMGLDSSHLYEYCLRQIKEKAPSAAIQHGATIGLRIWGGV
jgi:hypothetical protein